MIECGPGLIDWARIFYVCTILTSDPHIRSLRAVVPRHAPEGGVSLGALFPQESLQIT